MNISTLRDPEPDSARVQKPEVGHWRRCCPGGRGGPGRAHGPGWIRRAARQSWGRRCLCCAAARPPRTTQLVNLNSAPPAPTTAQWLILIGVCTHLGCVPLNNAGEPGAGPCCAVSAPARGPSSHWVGHPAPPPPNKPSGEFNAWFCPCHGGLGQEGVEGSCRWRRQHDLASAPCLPSAPLDNVPTNCDTPLSAGTHYDTSGRVRKGPVSN